MDLFVLFKVYNTVSLPFLHIVEILVIDINRIVLTLPKDPQFTFSFYYLTKSFY